MSTDRIFKNPAEINAFRSRKKQKVAQEELREHNLEEIAKDCVYQFKKFDRKFIVVKGGGVHYYILFRKKLLSMFKENLVFAKSLTNVTPEMIDGKYGDSRVIVYDPLKKTTPNEEVYTIDLGEILDYKNFSCTDCYGLL